MLAYARHPQNKITDTTASARALGVTAIALYSVAALLALSLTYLVAASRGELRLPLLQRLDLASDSVSFDNSDDVGYWAMWAQGVSG